MKYAIKYLVMILAIVSLTYGAQNPAVAAPYSAFINWAPIIFIASLLGVMLAGVYYFIGYLLNNQRIKTAAVSELVQAGGSIVLVIVIIAVLYMLGSSDFSFGTFLGPSGSASISNICNTYLNYQNPQYPVYLNSNSFDKNYFSSSPSTLPEPTTAVCQYIIGSPAKSRADIGLNHLFLLNAQLAQVRELPFAVLRGDQIFASSQLGKSGAAGNQSRQVLDQIVPSITGAAAGQDEYRFCHHFRQGGDGPAYLLLGDAFKRGADGK